MSMYFTKNDFNLQQFYYKIYLWNKSTLFDVYEISIPSEWHLICFFLWRILNGFPYQPGQIITN